MNRTSRAVDAIALGVPLLLAVAAEAAWIAVLGGLLQEYALRLTIVGLPQMAAFVLAGVVAARVLQHRLGVRWPMIGLGLIAIGTIVGVLLSPGARAALGSDGLAGLGGALGENPGGALAGLAVLRGFSHAGHRLREDTIGRMFGGGLVVITFAAMAGNLVADPFRAPYLADVLTESLVFAACAVLALALTRQGAVGPEARVEWPRNPAWVGLLLLLVGLVVVLAVPAAAVAPRAMDLAIAILLGPLLIIGMVAGWTRSGARFLGIVLLAGGLLVALSPRLSGGDPQTPAGSNIGGSSAAPTTADQNVLFVGGGLATLIGIVGVLLLIRLWMRQSRTLATDVDEVRSIDRGGAVPVRRPRLPALPFRRPPTDAVAAYRDLLEDLDARPGVRREVTETPAEHAHRLRVRGHSGLSLELLAADYALARFGDVPLTSREDRRAVARWRGLRRALSRVVVSPEDPASEPPDQPG
jgi:hypothetical protein